MKWFWRKKKIVAPQQGYSYWGYVKRQFRKNKRALISLYILCFLLFVFVFADFLANNKPIAARHEGKMMFPVLQEYLVDLGLSEWPEGYGNVFWKDLEYDFVIWPLIPYGPQEQDINNSSAAPGGDQEVDSWRWRHWFGTDDLGRDLLSAMIHATRVDLSIGVVAMGVAALIGIFFGAMAGFYGDDRLQMSRIRLILNLLFLFFAFFYAFSVRSYIIADATAAGISPMLWQLLISLLIFFGIMGLANLLAIPLRKIPALGRKVRLPVDITVSRMIEVIVSIPVIFLIIMVLAVVEGGSIFWVMVVIGLTRWTGIARFIRAELLRIRNLEYVEAAQALGYSNKRILLKHAIPNAMAPVFISIAFGIASAILIESFLSFIGIGLPPDEQTWGSMLNLGRTSPKDWWLALFPGLAIFVTVTIFNLIGEGLTDALDPRMKQ